MSLAFTLGLLVAGCELPGSYYDQMPSGGDPEPTCTPHSVDRWTINCDGTVTDTQTGKLWQQGDSGDYMNWANAGSYCSNLSLAGHSDWRLPNINELRSLIVGCPGTVTGGACQVTDPGCLASSCYESSNCYCSDRGGPGEDGRYATPGVWEWNGNNWYWSSSAVSGGSGYAWGVGFYSGYVYAGGVVSNVSSVRCVRP